tara:strand:+ start:117 stop:392 length:276 start_codon:yes stop_codon:yes gene_type:complete
MPKINLLNSSNRKNSNFSNTIKYDESIKAINGKINALNSRIDTLVIILNTFAKQLEDVTLVSISAAPWAAAENNPDVTAASAELTVALEKV